MLFGCKNKNFSYIKAKPTKKFGHNGFLRGESPRIARICADFLSYAVLICTFPAAPIYNCLVFNHSPLFDDMANALVFIAPLLYALVIYLAFIASRKRTLRPIQL